MVSIFVTDDRPLIWLKQALNWQAIKADRIINLQKRRWGLWVAVVYGFVFAVIGPDVGQGSLRLLVPSSGQDRRLAVRLQLGMKSLRLPSLVVWLWRAIIYGAPSILTGLLHRQIRFIYQLKLGSAYFPAWPLRKMDKAEFEAMGRAYSCLSASKGSTLAA
jgi:hypothetical protein